MDLQNENDKYAPISKMLERDFAFPFAYGNDLKGLSIGLHCDGETSKSIQRFIASMSMTYPVLGHQVPDRRTFDRWSDQIEALVDKQIYQHIDEVKTFSLFSLV